MLIWMYISTHVQYYITPLHHSILNVTFKQEVSQAGKCKCTSEEKCNILIGINKKYKKKRETYTELLLVQDDSNARQSKTIQTCSEIYNPDGCDKHFRKML